MVVVTSFLTIALYCYYFLPFEFAVVDGSFPPQDIKLIQYCEILFYCFTDKSNKSKRRMEKHPQRPSAGVRPSKRVIRDLKSPVLVAGSASESKSRRRRDLKDKSLVLSGSMPHAAAAGSIGSSLCFCSKQTFLCSCRSLIHSLPDKTENQLLLRQD